MLNNLSYLINLPVVAIKGMTQEQTEAYIKKHYKIDILEEPPEQPMILPINETFNDIDDNRVIISWQLRDIHPENVMAIFSTIRTGWTIIHYKTTNENVIIDIDYDKFFSWYILKFPDYCEIVDWDIL